MSESAKETIERQTFVIENQAESIFVQTNAMSSLREKNARLRAVIVQIAAVAKDNHSDDNNSTAMALRFVEEIANRAVTS